MNFGVNRGILVAGLITVGVSVLDRLWVKSTINGVTKIVVGGYIFILVTAFIDLIPGARPLATGLAMLAMLTVLLLYGPAILGKVASLTNTSSVATNTAALSSKA